MNIGRPETTSNTGQITLTIRTPTVSVSAPRRSRWQQLLAYLRGLFA